MKLEAWDCVNLKLFVDSEQQVGLLAFFYQGEFQLGAFASFIIFHKSKQSCKRRKQWKIVQVIWCEILSSSCNF